MRVMFVVGVTPEVASMQPYSKMLEGHGLQCWLSYEGDGVALFALNGNTGGGDLSAGVVGVETVPGKQLREFSFDGGTEPVMHTQG